MANVTKKDLVENGQSLSDKLAKMSVEELKSYALSVDSMTLDFECKRSAISAVMYRLCWKMKRSDAFYAFKATLKTTY